MTPNLELKAKMIKAGIKEWQSFLMCRDEADVDRLVAKAKRRIEDFRADGIKPELWQPDSNIIERAEAVKALF